MLASFVKDYYPNLKVAWYSGRQELSEHVNMKHFDYIKLGPYIEENGPLNSKTTNQVMLHIDNSCGKPIVKDITSRFWKYPLVELQTYHEGLFKERKNAFKLKGGFSARHTPFAVLIDNAAPVMAFYSEANTCTIEEIMKALNNPVVYGRIEG